MEVMDMIAQLVEFLGKACGENCEIALQDLREGKMCITAIANGQISGRGVGSPPTDLALRFITDRIWEDQDYISNYEGRTKDGRSLHSSTYFIKNQGRLEGLLCVNIDTAQYEQLSERILKLAGLNRAVQPETEQRENFYQDMEEAIHSVFHELGMEEQGRFSQEERLRIIERLMERGVFLLRGSVSRVAEKLKCSDASLYRYMATINKTHKKRQQRSRSRGAKEELIYDYATS